MQVQSAEASWRRLSPVGGWFSREAAMTFAMFDEVQQANSVSGDLFEIGTHHGRSAMLLASFLRKGERLAVCDIFDQQAGNASRSGSGDQQIFERNVRPLLPDPQALELFICLSDKLTAEKIGAGHRFFHIDGGHNTDEALSDLRLAAQVLAPAGVIVLDDAFRDVWPGVTEALLLFLQEFPEFVGLALGFNKMFFVRRDHAEMYRRKLVDREELARYGICYPWHVKQVPLAGSELLVYYVPEWFKSRSLPNVVRGFSHKWGQRRLPVLSKSVSSPELSIP